MVKQRSLKPQNSDRYRGNPPLLCYFERPSEYVSDGMFENYSKGQLAVIKLQERALEKGWTVCFPTVESRFDVVAVDLDGKCHKVQVKYVDSNPTNSEGAVALDLRKQTRNNGQTKLYSKDEIDAVVAFIQKTKQLIWVGPEVFHMKASVTFRYAKPKNNQLVGVRMISDFVW
jgi:hypothetical protein